MQELINSYIHVYKNTKSISTILYLSMEASIILFCFSENPYLDVPVLNCSAAEDVFHVASERLTSISSIPQLLDIYGKITASGGENLEYTDSSEDSMCFPLVTKSVFC